MGGINRDSLAETEREGEGRREKERLRNKEKGERRTSKTD